MKITEILNLIGAKSTDKKILDWFEENKLAKPPKTITANQGQKHITDKQNELNYSFDFEVINDLFYPPVSPKNNNYTFECVLSSVTLFERKKKGNIEKPNGFWENYINPYSTYEDCCLFFNSNGKQNRSSVFFGKMINEFVKLEVWMSADKKKIDSIYCRINTDWELYSIYDFIENNIHNTVKQAYLLLVKWLFDNKYLLLSDEAYKSELDFNDKKIRDFISKYLKNHIWADQLDIEKEPDILLFLHGISSTFGIELKNEEKMQVYIRDLYLKEAGVWDKYNNIYNNNYNSETLDNIAKSAYLDEKQCKSFLTTLSDLFNYYKIHKVHKE